jgi:hypothetical protein
MNGARRAIALSALVGLAATAAAFVPGTASATACPPSGPVKSFHGYVIVAFRHQVSGPDGGNGTMTVTLDRGIGLVHFKKVVPLKTGAPVAIFRGKTTGVMTVDDAYSDTSGVTGAQKDDGRAKVNVTIGFTNTPAGCAYTVVVGAATLAITSSGKWPSAPEHGVSIAAQTPVRATPGNLNLQGDVTVPLGAPTLQGNFGTFDALGTTGSWEMAFASAVKASGTSAPTASIQWHFKP